MTVSISIPIVNGDDDATELDNNSFFLSTGPTLEIIAQAGAFRNNVGLRFVPYIPRRAGIISATLDVEIISSDNDDMDGDIVAEAVDHALDFVDLADVTARPRTTASVQWTTVASGLGVITSPDFKDVLQEVISRPGFDGGAVVIFLDGLDSVTSQCDIASYENIVSASFPILNVEYSLPYGDVPSVITATDVQRIPDKTVGY